MDNCYYILIIYRPIVCSNIINEVHFFHSVTLAKALDRNTRESLDYVRKPPLSGYFPFTLKLMLTWRILNSSLARSLLTVRDHLKII